VGADFGWKKPTVLDKIRVLDAPEPVQTLIEEQRIPSTHYTQLLRQLPEDQQVSLARQAAEEEWTRQDLKRRLLHLTEEPEEGPSVSLSEGISGYTPGFLARSLRNMRSGPKPIIALEIAPAASRRQVLFFRSRSESRRNDEHSILKGMSTFAFISPR
jgi:hypothetical protein